MSELTDLGTVKDWLGLTSKASSDDAVLEILIAGVSAALESWLGRTFEATAYSETRNGTGKTEIMVKQYPIISVASVTVNGNAIAARTSPCGSGWVNDDDTIYLSGSCFHRGIQNIVLSYSAGYATIPDDLAQATTEFVAFLYRERDRIGLSSKSQGAGETTAYLKDMPPHLKLRFQQFARTVVPPT